MRDEPTTTAPDTKATVNKRKAKWDALRRQFELVQVVQQTALNRLLEAQRQLTAFWEAVLDCKEGGDHD